MARSGAGRQARSRRHARLPHVDELSLLRHRAADRDLVREERPQHLRHASVHPSAVGGGGSGLGIAQRLGDLQDHRAKILGTGSRPSRCRTRRRADADPARYCRRDSRNPSRSRIGRRANANSSPALPPRRSTVVERDYPNTYRRFTALGPLADKLGNGGKGIDWKRRTRSQGLGELNYAVNEDGPTKGGRGSRPTSTRPKSSCISRPKPMARLRSRRGRRSVKMTGRDHTHLGEVREDEKIRFRDLQCPAAQDHLLATWSGIESEQSATPPATPTLTS